MVLRRLGPLLSYALGAISLFAGLVLWVDAATNIRRAGAIAYAQLPIYGDVASATARLKTLTAEYAAFLGKEKLKGGRLSAAWMNSTTGRWEPDLLNPGLSLNSTRLYLFSRGAIKDACDEANLMQLKIQWARQHFGTQVKKTGWGLPLSKDLLFAFLHFSFGSAVVFLGVRFLCRGFLIAGKLRPVRLQVTS